MSYKKYAVGSVYGVDTVTYSRAGGPVPAGAVSGVVNAVAGGAARAFRAVHNKFQERAAVRALSELEDWVLEDIGVPRSEIRAMVRKMMENPGLDHRTFRQ